MEGFTMNLLQRIISLILCFIIAVLNFIFPSAAVINIKSNLGLEIKASQIEFHKDTHGGFHGDGEELIIFTPAKEQIEKIEAEWNKTPVDSEIALLIYPESEYNGLDLMNYLPETEGFWFYKNRGKHESSINISFAFFDGEKVFFYELDT